MICQRILCQHKKDRHSDEVGICNISGCNCYRFEEKSDENEPQGVQIVRRIYALRDKEPDMQFVPSTIREVLEYIDFLKASK